MIDISRTLGPDMLVYPGDPVPVMRRCCTIGPGSPYNVLQLGWTTHLLTHIDAPLHFFPDGASIHEIPVDRFMGECLVIEADGPAVLPRHLPDIDLRGLNLLFKTRNSADWDPHVYREDHVHVSAEAAEALVSCGVNLVGIDYLSIDRFGDEAYPAHRTLLGSGVLILEGIDLAAVMPGRYTLIALPLKIENGDGSPVRAVLIP